MLRGWGGEGDEKVCSFLPVLGEKGRSGDMDGVLEEVLEEVADVSITQNEVIVYSGIISMAALCILVGSFKSLTDKAVRWNQERGKEERERGSGR